MTRKVLVPLDGSPAAEAVLPYAGLVAARTGAALHLLTVVSEGEDASRVGESFAYLERKSNALRTESLTVSANVTAGLEAQEILSEVETVGADLIAMSTHGRSGLMRWMLGSVAEKVVHAATTPILLVRAHEGEGGPPPRIDHILMPMDGSELSLSVLPYVEDLAAALGSDLVLYNAVLPLDIYPGTEMAPARVGAIIDDLLAQGQAFLANLAKEIEGRGKVKARCMVTIGFPVDEIVRVGVQAKAGLVAMATHGRSGVNRWVMGSVADGVLRRSSLPCLLVRPDQAAAEEQ